MGIVEELPSQSCPSSPVAFGTPEFISMLKQQLDDWRLGITAAEAERPSETKARIFMLNICDRWLAILKEAQDEVTSNLNLQGVCV